MKFFFVCLFVLTFVTLWSSGLCKEQYANETIGSEEPNMVSRIKGYCRALGHCNWDEEPVKDETTKLDEKVNVSTSNSSTQQFPLPEDKSSKKQYAIPEVSVCPFLENSSIAIMRNVQCNQFVKDLEKYDTNMVKKPIKFASLTNNSSSGKVCFKFDEISNDTEPELVAMCVPNSNWSICPRDSNTTKYLSLDESDEKHEHAKVDNNGNSKDKAKNASTADLKTNDADFALCWNAAEVPTNRSNSTTQPQEEMCIVSKSKSLIIRKSDFCLLHEWKSDKQHKNEHCFSKDSLRKTKGTRPTFSLFDFFSYSNFFSSNKTGENDGSTELTVISRKKDYYGKSSRKDENLEDDSKTLTEDVVVPITPTIQQAPPNKQLIFPKVSVCPFVANSSIAIMRDVKCNQFVKDLQEYNLDKVKKPVKFATLTNDSSSGKVCFKLDEAPDDIEPELVAMCVPNGNWSICPRDKDSSKYLSLDDYGEQEEDEEEEESHKMVVGKRNREEEDEEEEESPKMVVGKRNREEEMKHKYSETDFESSEVDFALCWNETEMSTNGSSTTKQPPKEICIISKSKSLIMRNSDLCILHEWKSDKEHKDEHCFLKKRLRKKKGTKSVFNLFGFFSNSYFFSSHKSLKKNDD